MTPPDSPLSAIILVWIFVLLLLCVLLWPRRRGRTLARQIFALASLGFREGIRLKLLWTVFALALIPGTLAFFSDADGTHAGRARLILDTCLGSGEILGAALVVLLSALSVAREIEARVMHTMGVKPVPRWAILVGKALGFWGIEICFLAALVVFTGGLVRAVPLRAETRSGGKLAESGTWEDLQRNALTTRIYTQAQGVDASKSEFKFVRPGASRSWQFTVPPGDGAQRSVRLVLSSTNTFAAHIQGVHLTIAPSGGSAILERTENIPQGRSVEFFFNPAQLTSRELTVTLTAGAGERAPSLIVAQPNGVRLGSEADGFASNLLKAFVQMALQGWVLAMITTAWSGVLSFAVTVALGVIFLLGGELSSHVVALLQSEIENIQSGGTQALSQGQTQLETIQALQRLLGLLPDFHAGGGPSAFVDGAHLPWLALANIALWMGVVCAAGWSLPGLWSFQRREVGK